MLWGPSTMVPPSLPPVAQAGLWHSPTIVNPTRAVLFLKGYKQANVKKTLKCVVVIEGGGGGGAL